MAASPDAPARPAARAADVPVAFDVGPLSGPRTGIGAAVAALQTALAGDRRVELVPYVTSFRAKLPTGVRRLPIPAVVAHRLWAHTDHPRVDRWLRHATVVHGTNYVVPPTFLPRLVSVYDCWFLHNPEHAHPAVVRAGRVLKRSIERGGVIVHASSHATAEALRELFPAVDVRVIHLAPLPLVAPASGCPIPELDRVNFIVSVATLEVRKNLPRLVQAFGAVATTHRDLRLVLAGGDGDDRANVNAAIDALPRAIGARVLITGYVDDAARSWLLHNARVLAYPSLDEGFGFPLLDAMHAGVPIVASTAGSIPEVAGEAALLVDALDVDAIAAALDRALTDSATRDALRTGGTQRLSSFSWSETANRMIELYLELSAGR
jgi:glycosyltransferase involved in cell wall biosynthesis